MIYNNAHMIDTLDFHVTHLRLYCIPNYRYNLSTYKVVRAERMVDDQVHEVKPFLDYPDPVSAATILRGRLCNSEKPILE